MSIPTITWTNWCGDELSIPLPRTQEEYEHLLQNKSYLCAPAWTEIGYRALHYMVGNGLTYEQWCPLHTQKMNMAIAKLTKADKLACRYLKRAEDGWPPAAPAAAAFCWQTSKS